MVSEIRFPMIVKNGKFRIYNPKYNFRNKRGSGSSNTTKIESHRFERPIFISLIAIDLILFLIAFGLAYKITRTTGYGMQHNLYNQNRQKFKYP